MPPHCWLRFRQFAGLLLEVGGGWALPGLVVTSPVLARARFKLLRRPPAAAVCCGDASSVACTCCWPRTRRTQTQARRRAVAVAVRGVVPPGQVYSW